MISEAKYFAFAALFFSAVCFAGERTELCAVHLVSAEGEVEVASVASLLGMEQPRIAALMSVLAEEDPRRVAYLELLLEIDNIRFTCTLAAVCELPKVLKRVATEVPNLENFRAQGLPKIEEKLIRHLAETIHADFSEPAPYATFREWVRAKMEKKKIPDYETLAQKIDYGLFTVQGHLRNPESVSTHTLSVYAKFFGVHVDDAYASIQDLRNSEARKLALGEAAVVFEAPTPTPMALTDILTGLQTRWDEAPGHTFGPMGIEPDSYRALRRISASLKITESETVAFAVEFLWRKLGGLGEPEQNSLLREIPGPIQKGGRHWIGFSVLKETDVILANIDARLGGRKRAKIVNYALKILNRELR